MKNSKAMVLVLAALALSASTALAQQGGDGSAPGDGASTQWFNFSNNKEHLSIGLHGGSQAFSTEYADFGMGMSLQAYGVYVDFLAYGPAHRHDNHVNNTQWQDSASTSVNLGYQIPVLPWLRVMPLVGYMQTNYGLTDASTVNVSSDEYSATIYHDYNVQHRDHYFNFGVGLFVKPIRYIDVYAVASRYAIYGGISINLDAFFDE